MIKYIVLLGTVLTNIANANQDIEITKDEIMDLTVEEMVAIVNTIDYVYSFTASDRKRKEFRFPFESKYESEISYSVTYPKQHGCNPKAELSAFACKRYMLYETILYSTYENCDYELRKWKKDFEWNIENGKSSFSDCVKIPNALKGKWL